MSLANVFSVIQILLSTAELVAAVELSMDMYVSVYNKKAKFFFIDSVLESFDVLNNYMPPKVQFGYYIKI